MTLLCLPLTVYGLQKNRRKQNKQPKQKQTWDEQQRNQAASGPDDEN